MSSYHIDWSGGSAVPAIPGKTPIILPQKTNNSTATSITLTGKGIPNYGEIQQENFLHLMEHFAAPTPPANPTIGQIWYNTTENILYMRVDPDNAAVTQQLFWPQSPKAWVQIWPNSIAWAGLDDYNMLALQINKIIGAPTGSTETTAYGWGQTDLVPVYTNINTLDPAYPAPAGYSFPESYSNESWVILLSRLRKAMRHTIGVENTAPMYGLVNDGRPGPAGNALANMYNDYQLNPAGTAPLGSNEFPGTLPPYTSGWGGAGLRAVDMIYSNAVSRISDLDSNRFLMMSISSESQLLTGATRTTNWNSTKVHNVELTFASQNAAKAYFNAGGYLKFSWIHTPSVADAINNSWQTFLSQHTDICFDYKGMRRATTYHHADIASSGILGFYDLTTINQVIYERRRGFDTGPGDVYASGPSITDGGILINARTATVGSSFKVYFDITFAEGVTGSEIIQGTMISNLYGYKANLRNTNFPVLAQPVGVSSGTFNG